MSYGPRTAEKTVAINVLWILKMAVLAPTALLAGARLHDRARRRQDRSSPRRRDCRSYWRAITDPLITPYPSFMTYVAAAIDEINKPSMDHEYVNRSEQSTRPKYVMDHMAPMSWAPSIKMKSNWSPWAWVIGRYSSLCFCRNSTVTCDGIVTGIQIKARAGDIAA